MTPTICNRFIYGSAPQPVQQVAFGTPHPHKLVLAPGDYFYPGAVSSSGKKGAAFRFDQPGLYGVMNPLPDTANGVVDGGNYAIVSGDPFAVAAAACALCTTGEFDTQLSGETFATALARWREAALYRSLGALCGYLAAFVRSVLHDCGYETRSTQWLSVAPYNGFFDGHICLEFKAKAGGPWILLDAVFARRFVSWTGPISLADYVQQGGAVVQVADCRPFGLPYATATATSGFHTELYARMFPFEVAYQHVAKIPGIRLDSEPLDGSGEKVCWAPPGTESAIPYWTAQGYTFLSQSEWLARFYP